MYILTKKTRVNFELTDTEFYKKQKMVSSNIRASTIPVFEAYPTHAFYKIHYENIRILFGENEFNNGKNKAWEVLLEEINGDIKVNNGFIKIISVIKELDIIKQVNEYEGEGEIF